jgi:hypothetical protein
VNHNSEDGTSVITLDNDKDVVKWVRSSTTVKYEINGTVYEKCGRSDVWDILPNYSLANEQEGSIFNLHTEYDSLFPFRYSPSDIFRIFERIISLDDTSSVFKAINADLSLLCMLKKQVVKSILNINLIRQKENTSLQLINQIIKTKLTKEQNQINKTTKETNQINEVTNQNTKQIKEEIQLLHQLNEKTIHLSNQVNQVNKINEKTILLNNLNTKINTKNTIKKINTHMDVSDSICISLQSLSTYL